MSVRVIARIRPLLKLELEKDSIVDAVSSPLDPNAQPNIIRIPNPKNASEAYSFHFNSVYGQIAPTVKHLFNGFDVTIFAYGVTGTGKTHTMRGGKTLAERGVIPRLLSSVYRRGRKIEKDSEGKKRIEVVMSYYEIYNDRVFDLFEPPAERTAAGLPIRDNNGKTMIAGLTEKPCTTLKEFEQLYDQANVNRSTSATKLNAHSSRSHAILCVKVCQVMEDHTIISTASAIDLAGSEDNRRTENMKERLVESSSINKSLFALAQCVEAISKKQARIPYRESKMTRILSLGQNNGLTVMILNLAPIRSYHLDTLSSLNFANRTKKIEVREIENEPIFRGLGKQQSTISGPPIQRHPLRPITTSANISLKGFPPLKDKPAKAFAVYAEKGRPTYNFEGRKEASLKRGSDALQISTSRPKKTMRTSDHIKPLKSKDPQISRADIEELINRTVEEKLASRALMEMEKPTSPSLSAEVQRRLDALEQRIEKKEDGRAEGLQFLLMAKQHQAHGEDASALKMYRLALPFFPDNEKLAHKILVLQEKLRLRHQGEAVEAATIQPVALSVDRHRTDHSDEDYHDINDPGEDEEDNYEERDGFQFKVKSQKPRVTKLDVFRDNTSNSPAPEGPLSPRTQQLLRIINTRDVVQIRSLKGMGAKKAETIVNYISALDHETELAMVSDLKELHALKGVGSKTVEAMRSGISC